MELLWKRGKSPASARSRIDMVFTYTTIGASLDSTSGEQVLAGNNYLAVVEHQMSPRLQLLCSGGAVRLEE